MEKQTEMQDRLLEVLRRRETRYFDLLRRMVEINSFTANRDGVNALGQLTAQTFEALGFFAETVPAENETYGSHLVMTREAPKASRQTPRIGLISHLDTVFPPEEEKLYNFVWSEEGDRIYGPGTVDIKGGTVVIFMMLDALKTVAPEIYDSVTWVVLLNSAEERIASDFGELCRDRLVSERTLGALVFEGGIIEDGKRARLVVARKGMGIFRVTVNGRASHAGSAHNYGANAIAQMADVIRKIESWTDYDQKLTFNVGSVHGGTVTNRVPHAAVAEIEMRAFDAEVFGQGMAKMLGLEEYASVFSANDHFPCAVTVEVLTQEKPWPRNEATDQLFDAWKQAAPALGLEAVTEERGGLSDGNQFWESVPTVDGLGPGGANAHCSERSADGSKEPEYATRSTFVPKALLNISAILELRRR
jgi:glutamate carboxypeptidase